MPIQPPGSTDEELIARVKQRDGKALEALYDRHAATALGLAFKILRERAAAEEVVQESFWRVWKSASTFDRSRGSLTAWLFTIVHNLTIDELHRLSARRAAPLDDENAADILEVADGAPDVQEVVWAQYQHERVRQALQELPAAQRDVIELAYFRGLSREQVAAQLEEPLGTIHTRARLALQKLRTILTAEGLRD